MIETSNTLYVLGSKEDLEQFQVLPLLQIILRDIEGIRLVVSTENKLIYLITSLAGPIVSQIERLAPAWPKLTFQLLYLNNEKSIAGFARFRGEMCEERREYGICKDSEPEQINAYNDFVDDYFLKLWFGVHKGERT